MGQVKNYILSESQKHILFMMIYNKLISDFGRGRPGTTKYIRTYYEALRRTNYCLAAIGEQYEGDKMLLNILSGA